jgi:hypothetical protein
MWELCTLELEQVSGGGTFATTEQCAATFAAGDGLLGAALGGSVTWGFGAGAGFSAGAWAGGIFGGLFCHNWLGGGANDIKTVNRTAQAHG